MKAVAAQALLLVSVRQRQQLGHAGHVMMKRGIETSDLRHLRIMPAEFFNQRNLLRQMIGIEGADFL